jgi:hypothetical protein
MRRVTNQEFYWGIVTNQEPPNEYTPPKGTFIGGPSGTSQAPHLYLSEGKARNRAGTLQRVVKVKLEIVE